MALVHQCHPDDVPGGCEGLSIQAFIIIIISSHLSATLNIVPCQAMTERPLEVLQTLIWAHFLAGLPLPLSAFLIKFIDVPHG